MLSYFNLSHSTIYLLSQCGNSDRFNINLVDVVDVLAAVALVHYNQNSKFNYVTLEQDVGKITKCHVVSANIKNARKLDN